MGRGFALVAGGALLGLAVLLQASWRLSPPVSRLVTHATARSVESNAGRIHARGVPRATVPGSSPILLTEVSTANGDVILDDDLFPSDWIELYNQTESPVRLAGWRLVESGRPRRGWVFPEITLGPGAYLTVWASGKDRVGSAAARRVNTRLTRGAPHHHVVDDFHTPVPWDFETVRRARWVRVDIPVPEAGLYTLWMKARADGLTGTLRVRVPGAGSRAVTLAGGRVRHLRIGDEGGVRVKAAGLHSVSVATQAGTVDVIHLALVRAGSDPPDIDDRYARHLHASFRLGRGREGVMLVDPMGIVRDEAPAVDHASTLTLQREPGALAWRVAPPTPRGRRFGPAPELARYPSLSAAPLRVGVERPAGVEELRYTVDGSVPTGAAARLTGPLELTRPTALRVRGYRGGEPATPIVTRQFWVGPPPPGALALMLALDPHLLTDLEIGILPNQRWRRQQQLPDDSALGSLRLTRRRVWARERRHWLKPAHLLLVEGEEVLFQGRARIRVYAHGGYHLRMRDPARPTRDPFGRTLGPPGRSVLVDEDAGNIPAYEMVNAAGGIAPRTAWGLWLINDDAPVWKTLVEPVDDDFLRARWGHTNFDLIKGRPNAVKRGTTAAYDALAHRLERGTWTAADVAPLIDLPSLVGLHLATLFIDSGRPNPRDQWQVYLAFDHATSPPHLRTIGWDLDLGLRSGPPADPAARWLVGTGFRSRFLPDLVVTRLLDSDPVFRERYLRKAEQVLNHVLTPAWWEERRWTVAERSDPARAGVIAHAFRRQAAVLFQSLARDLKIAPPRVVRVEVDGAGDVTIDGYAYRGGYTGRYFAGGALEVMVPPERRPTFREFTVNGRPAPGSVLRVAVTDDLEVVARFAP
jgi:hypothetical protein